MFGKKIVKEFRQPKNYHRCLKTYKLKYQELRLLKLGKKGKKKLKDHNTTKKENYFVAGQQNPDTKHTLNLLKKN